MWVLGVQAVMIWCTTYHIVPNFCGKIFLWILWLNIQSWKFFLQKIGTVHSFAVCLNLHMYHSQSQNLYYENERSRDFEHFHKIFGPQKLDPYGMRLTQFALRKLAFSFEVNWEPLWGISLPGKPEEENRCLSSWMVANDVVDHISISYGHLKCILTMIRKFFPQVTGEKLMLIHCHAWLWEPDPGMKWEPQVRHSSPSNNEGNSVRCSLYQFSFGH